MSKKKKSTNKVLPLLVLAAILGGGYYWLSNETAMTNDANESSDLRLPGEGDSNAPSEATTDWESEDNTKTSALQLQEDSVTEHQENTNIPVNQTVGTKATTGVSGTTSAGKNAYVDEYGNVIYTKPNGKDPITYKIYKQGRWGYSVKYPSFLAKESHSQSSDGGTFEDGKGRKLATYASWNVFNETIAELYHKDFPEVKTVTYKKLFRKQKCYIKSGYTKDNRIFYLKEAIYTKDDQEVIATMIFYYPKSFNKEADKIVKEIFTSFPILKR